MPAQVERQTQRLILLTSWCKIEGTYHFMPGIRLSDAVNSEMSQKARYLPVTDVVVHHLETGQELLRAQFMLIAHTQIAGIVPCAAVTKGTQGDTGSKDTSSKDVDMLIDQMNEIMTRS